MMPTWLEKLGFFARAPDARSQAEVVADIEQELEFHLAERTAELEQAGYEPAAARAEAEQRFGDYARVRRECVKIQLGEKIMWQRIQGVSMVIMMLTMMFVAYMLVGQNRALLSRQDPRVQSNNLYEGVRLMESRGGFDQLLATKVKPFVEGPYLLPDGRSSTRSAATAAWRSELEQDPKDTRRTEEVATRLLALPDQRGIDILVDLADDLSQEHFDPILKPLIKNPAQPGFLRAVQALVEGPERPEVAVLRGRNAVRAYSWHQFPDAEWYAKWRDEPPAEVLLANADRWAMDLLDVCEGNRTLDQELIVGLECARPELYAAFQLDLGSLLGKRLDPVAIRRIAPNYPMRITELLHQVATWIEKAPKQK